MADNVLTPIENISNSFAAYLKDEALHSFLAKLVASPKKFGVFSFPIKQIDPLACLEILAEPTAYQFYWEKTHDDFAMSAGNSVHTISAGHNRRFHNTQKQIDQLQSDTLQYSAINHSYSGLHLLGGAAFFDEPVSKGWKGFEAASFTLPEWLIIKDGQLGIVTLTIEAAHGDTASALFQKLTTIIRNIAGIFNLDSEDILAPEEPSKNIVLNNSSDEYDNWIHAVEKARDHIKANKFDKIVLARKLDIELNTTVTPTFILNRLRQQYPNCYSFLIKFPASDTFIGCSPERLISFHNKYLRTDALAGSIKRGASATEDAIFEKRLLNSKKDESEHNFVTKAIEERLKKVTKKIEHSHRPTVKKLSNVQHLYTPIRAWIKSNVDQLSIVKELHPTPAVGGYPWEQAAPYIKELEKFDRGWYAGPIGWLNTTGAGEFAVAIRSGLIGREKAQFFAGCGIVKDSDAAAEWDETNLKLMPMLSALNNG